MECPSQPTKAGPYFVMNRTGTFTLKRQADNQCRDRDTMDFQYKLRILFSNKLDADGFLVENSQIHDAITGLDLSGSCEQIESQICESLAQFFADRGLEVYAFRCGITPAPAPADLPSWIEAVWTNPIHPHPGLYLQALGML